MPYYVAYYICENYINMITVDLDKIKADVSALLASYLGKKYDDTLFQMFHDHFRELLQRYDLADLRLFVRPPAKPSDPGYDRTAPAVISIIPMRTSDAIILHTILGEWSAALQVG